jgi:hypothetical protein
MEGFADYESEEDDDQPPAPVLPSNDSDSEEEGLEAEDEKVDETPAQVQAKALEPKPKESGKKTTSAASALLSATAKPDFLNPKSKCEAFDIRYNEKAETEETVSQDEPPAKRQALPVTTSEGAADKTSAVIPPSRAPAPPGLDKNKKDAKERVKTQRVRGQSAHATWKSEVCSSMA